MSAHRAQTAFENFPISRRELTDFALIFVISAAFYLWVADRGDILGNLSDGAAYLILADMFSPWANTPAWGLWPLKVFLFPPLYPVSLGLLGGGSETLSTAYALTALMQAMAAGAVYLWLCSLSIERIAAMLLTAGFALSAGSLSSVLIIQSEALFIALVFVSLTFACGRSRGLMIAAVCGGLCVLARTAGIALIVAGLLWGLRGRLRSPSVVAAFLLPGLVWFVFGRVFGRSATYTNALPDLAQLLPRSLEILGANLTVFPDALGALFNLYNPAGSAIFAMLLFVLAVPVWCLRIRHNQLDAWFLAIYLLMIVLWPYPEHQSRFVFVVLPVLLGYSYLFVGQLSTKFGMHRRVLPMSLVAAIPLLVSSGSTLNFVNLLSNADEPELRAFVRSPLWHQIDDKHEATKTLKLLSRVAEAQVEIDSLLPADACVVTTIPHRLPYYARRIARRVMSSDAPDTVFWERFRGCPYVFMVAARLDQKASLPPMYPYERIKQHMEVLNVELWYEEKRGGPVLAMLAKVAPP